MIRYKKLTAPTGFQLGSTTVFDVPTDQRSYHSFDIEVRGIGKGTSGVATILDARECVEYAYLDLDGKRRLFVEPKALRWLLDAENTKGDAYRNDVLHIPLSRFGVSEADWPLGGFKKAQLGLKLVQTLPSGGDPLNSLTGIEATAAWEPWPNTKLGTVTTFLKHTVAAPSAGDNSYELIPALDEFANIRNFFIYTQAAAGSVVNPVAYNGIKSVTWELGDTTVIECSKELMLERLARHPMKKIPSAPQGFYIPCDMRGRASDYVALFGADGKRMASKLTINWDGAVTPAPLHFLIEGVRGAEPAPAAQ